MNSSMHFYPLKDKDFRALKEIINRQVGIRIPMEKRLMLEARLQHRIRKLGLNSFQDYIKWLKSKRGSQDELHNFIDCVTTNKTDFFREPKHFDYLKTTLLPWFYHKQKVHFLKILSAGCATGEEVYTLAMVLHDFKKLYPQFDFLITGIDISDGALQEATLGVYDSIKLLEVPRPILRRFFLKNKDKTIPKFRLKPEIRSLVEFQNQNLMHKNSDLRESFHIIFCRNVLIYFDKKQQYTILNNLYDYFKLGGYLFIGHSETIMEKKLPYNLCRHGVYKVKN